MHFLIPFFILIVLMQIGCVHEPLEPLSNDPCQIPLSYEKDILPIMEASCNMTGCHAVLYSTYEGISPKLGSGLLVDRVFSKKGDPVLGMPPASDTYPNTSYQPLSEEDRQTLLCWTQQGYPR